MINIRNGSGGTYNVMRPQIEEPGIEYDFHQYLIWSGDIVYNSLTGAIVKIEDYEKDRPELIRRWFMSPKNFDLQSMMYQLRQEKLIRSNSNSGIKKYTIFTTMKCNAACPYCFQHGGNEDTMNIKTANDVADYIIGNWNKQDQIAITWFGGEPLVNKEVINVISEKLRKSNVYYRSSISSNGDLFPSVTDGELYLWNLKTVQFTIDIPGESYDALKGLPNGAYERLKDTAKRLGEHDILMQIRVHYHPNLGLDTAKQIVDDFKGIKNVRMYPAMIYDLGRTKEDYDSLLALDSYMIESKVLDFHPYMPQRPVYCMGDNPSTRCIRVDGSFTACEHYFEGERRGSIYEKIEDLDLIKKWTGKRKYDIKCYDCPLFPNCELLSNCPSIGKCEEGYGYYRVEQIRNWLSRIGGSDEQRETYRNRLV